MIIKIIALFIHEINQELRRLEEKPHLHVDESVTSIVIDEPKRYPDDPAAKGPRIGFNRRGIDG